MTTDNSTIKVATVNANDYQPSTVDSAMEQLLAQLGGLQKFVPNGSKVFVKANLVRDMNPDQAGTTHPQVLQSLAKMLTEQCNAQVTIGDSSGGQYTKAYMNTVYKKCGLLPIEQSGVATLNQDFGSHEVNIKGKKLKHIDIIDCFTNADVVINVTKLKTHSFTGYTGAVKNLYGLIPGLVKVTVHSMFPELNDFCQVLLDIEQYARPKIVLHILDAIIAMEGAGPTNGKPRFVGKLFASQDAYCCDYVATALFCQPLNQPLLRLANEQGLMADRLSRLDFDMDSLQSQYIEDFDRIDVVSIKPFLNMPQWIAKLAKRHLVPHVKMNKRCKKCKKCADHCPAKAITMGQKRAIVNDDMCIRCYCCQELCPFDAVRIKKPMVYKFACKFSQKKGNK